MIEITPLTESITIKNVKHSQFASHETNCFECTIYSHGATRIGWAENSGQGGQTNITFIDTETESEFRNLEADEDEIITDMKDPDGKLMTIAFSLEDHIDNLVVRWLETRDLKRSLKTKLLVVDDTCKHGQALQWKLEGQDPDRLYKAVLEVQTDLKNPKCLNLLPTNEAVEIFCGKLGDYSR